MKTVRYKIISFLLFLMGGIPLFLSAQESNHCAVKKSSYRLSLDSGKMIYAAHCITCHKVKGIDSTGLNPPLAGSKMVLGEKQPLIKIMLKGMAHEDINGKKYEQIMEPFHALKDTELADVLTYIRNSFGNMASSVKTKDVKTA